MADLYDVHNRQFIVPPSAEEMDAALRKSFGMTDETPIDTNDPEHVTRELMKPFPPSALYTRDMWQPGGGKKKLTYVQYQQVIRRLIHATGNRFHIRVLSTESTPWGTSKNGNALAMVSAIVELEIPALNSSRAATGVQVVTVGSGEDMYKGAVSDGVKKAAQAFGVAIDLAGADGEDTAPELPASHKPDAYELPPERPSRLSHVQSPQPAQNAPQGGAQAPAGNRQFAPAQPGTGGPATDGQKRALWKISNASKETIDQWASEYGESNANLTKGTASVLIDKHGGSR